MNRVLATILVASVIPACGGDTTPDAAPADDAVTKKAKPWVKAATTDLAMRAAAETRQPMRYIGKSGLFTVDLTFGRNDVRSYEVGIEMVSLRVADVPTIEHPVGFIKFDVLNVRQKGTGAPDRILVDTLLRNLGAPVQIVYDVHSVGELQGRLPEGGGSAKGDILGNLQLDSRSEFQGLSAIFERREDDTVGIEIEPFDLDLSVYKLDARMDKLARLMGARAPKMVARVSGTLELEPYLTDAPLPTFVRTPITVQSVEEVRKKLDEAVDDFEAHQHVLRRQGLDDKIIDNMTREDFEKQKEIAEKLGFTQKKSAVRR